MKKLLLVVVAMALLMQGCALLRAATPPEPSTPQQAWLLATHETKAFMAAANDGLEMGVISVVTHMEVEHRVVEARTALNVARNLIDAGDLKSAQGQMRVITSLMFQVRTLIGAPQ